MPANGGTNWSTLFLNLGCQYSIGKEMGVKASNDRDAGGAPTTPSEGLG